MFDEELKEEAKEIIIILECIRLIPALKSRHFYKIPIN